MSNIDPTKVPASIMELFKQRIDSEEGNNKLIEQVVDGLVETELHLRTKALRNIVEQINKKQKELSEIKPDQSFDKDGKVVREDYSLYSIKRMEEIKNSIQELNQAVEKAYSNFDWTEVKKLGEA